jgi:branched-chain amino acid aminotransferase
MLVYFNGRFVPEEEAKVSIFDRGLLYGDGLYETIRVYDGKPFLWDEHIQRFCAGAHFLKIELPESLDVVAEATRELIRRTGVKEAILRITLSRGVGPRGYSPKGAKQPSLAITIHPAPDKLPRAYKVVISSYKLATDDPLAAFKNCNKLRQIMARDEADLVGANEALLLNARGYVAEGTTTNLFWFEGETLCTPPIRAGILPGTTRAYVLCLAGALGISSRKKNIRPARLADADGAFVTSCGIEIMEVSHLDGRRLKRSRLTQKLRNNYRNDELEAL